MLEALGLNTRALLAVAADKFSGAVVVDCLIGSFAEMGDDPVSRVMEGFFNEDGGEEPDED